MPPPASQRRKTPRLLTVPLLLAGCATAPASEPPPVNACRLLPLQSYSRALNHRLADEVAAAPPDAAWPGVVADYVRLRDAVRACARG